MAKRVLGDESNESSSKRSEQEPAANTKRRRKAVLPSSFYKECNRIFREIETSKHDTRDIIKRLSRKAGVDKTHNYSQSLETSPDPTSPKSAAMEQRRQSVLLEKDSITSTVTPDKVTIDTGIDTDLKTLVAECLSSVKAMAELNKVLLTQNSLPRHDRLLETDVELDFDLNAMYSDLEVRHHLPCDN